MKAHRGQTPLMDWLNGGEHAVFLSRVPYTASWLVRPSVTKIYIRNMSENVVLSERFYIKNKGNTLAIAIAILFSATNISRPMIASSLP